VVNLGYPGTNSGQLVRDLPRILRSVSPDLVVVLVGVNDVWTRPVASTGSDDDPPPLWERLRTWRLYRIAVATLWPHELAVTTEEHTEDVRRGTVRYGDETFRFGYERDESFAWEEIEPVLESNLRTLVTRSRAAGVEVVLLTYPSPAAGSVCASRIARRVAADTGTALVDLAPAFAGLCPAGSCPEYLFPDTHPRPAGYALVAQTLADHLAASGTIR
jgi:lysophospholipase L1-like esterase